MLTTTTEAAHHLLSCYGAREAIRRLQSRRELAKTVEAASRLSIIEGALYHVINSQPV